MPIDKICEHCRTAFRVKPKDASRRYCGVMCWRDHEIQHGRPAAQIPPVEFSCKTCSKPFTMKPSYLAAYRKKHGKDPLYCSMPCSDIGRRKDADERHRTPCKNCGTLFYRSRRKSDGSLYGTQSLCSRQCKNEWTSKVYRAKNGSPQVTRRIKRNYVVLRLPAANGIPMHEVLEHRYVMEQNIRRKLFPDETVHHINGDRHDNRIENLELFSSNHGPGQRIADKLAHARELLARYADFDTPSKDGESG